MLCTSLKSLDCHYARSVWRTGGAFFFLSSLSHSHATLFSSLIFLSSSHCYLSQHSSHHSLALLMSSLVILIATTARDVDLVLICSLCSAQHHHHQCLRSIRHRSSQSRSFSHPVLIYCRSVSSLFPLFAIWGDLPSPPLLTGILIPFPLLPLQRGSNSSKLVSACHFQFHFLFLFFLIISVTFAIPHFLIIKLFSFISISSLNPFQHPW